MVFRTLETTEGMQLLRFQPKMLGRSRNYHTEECDDCREWEKRKCKVKGHSRKSKNSTLSDISLRQHISGKIRTSLSGKTCCEMNLCTHEFYEHQRHDIPWWACFDASYSSIMR